MQPNSEQQSEGDLRAELEDPDTPRDALSSEEELLSLGDHFHDLLKQPPHRNEPPRAPTKPPGAILKHKTEGNLLQGSGDARRRVFKKDLANSVRRAVRFLEPSKSRNSRTKDASADDNDVSDESIPSDPRGSRARRSRASIPMEAWSSGFERALRSQSGQDSAPAKHMQSWVRSATQSFHNLNCGHVTRLAKGHVAGKQQLVPKSQFFTWEMLNKAASSARSLRRQTRKNACTRLWLPGNGETIGWSGAVLGSEESTKDATSHFSQYAQQISRGNALPFEWPRTQCCAIFAMPCHLSLQMRDASSLHQHTNVVSLSLRERHHKKHPT